MDLQAYSWACGSSIRAISEPAEPAGATEESSEIRPNTGHQVHGLLSVWATAVHVAAAEGDVEDIETELGPAVGIPVGEPAIPSISEASDEENQLVEEQDVHEAIGEEKDVKCGRSPLQELPLDAEPGQNPCPAVSVVDSKELVKETTSDKDVGFLALLSAWSDDRPASRLLEEARSMPTIPSTAVPTRVLGTRDGRAPSKDFLKSLRSRFAKSRAPSPPPESKRWTTQDFYLYFGTDGALKPRSELRPVTEEDIAKEMQHTSRASPLLAELRMQLAADKVVKAPSTYSSFQRHLLTIGELCQLPVAEVLPVPRVRRADDLKAPICVEKQRGWKMRSWGMAFWSYECGEAACDCFRQYPPSTSSSDPCQLPVRARVDELGKYINILQDMDPQCSEDHYLAYPRYLASWHPFESIPKARRLFEQDLNARRKLWNPPGLKDHSAKWFDHCCLAVGLNTVPELAQQDSLQFGPPGMLTRLHVENCSAHVWHAQIQGRRMFVMFPPQDSERLYGHRTEASASGRDMREWISAVDIFSPAQKHSRFAECRAHVVMLEPGETVIVPAGWWQCSLSLEPFTTMSRRFWNRSNRLGMCDEIARLSDCREPGPRQRMRLDSQLPLLREQIQEDDLSSGGD
ncbi:unnamed protein product [Durusdinium trenchii]|uniref:Uncharacterized protein n=2 Tax=Durusdinium trenchii TaxID=1381693 RepID=A0ABP0P0P7_9DINO